MFKVWLAICTYVSISISIFISICMYLSRSGRDQGRVGSESAGSGSRSGRFKVQDTFKVKEAEAILEDWWSNGIWSGVGPEGIHNALLLFVWLSLGLNSGLAWGGWGGDFLPYQLPCSSIMNLCIMYCIFNGAGHW